MILTRHSLRSTARNRCVRKSKKVSQASVVLEGGIAGEQKSLTDDALGFVTTWVSTVANGFDALYTAAFPGNADQDAISGAMTDFAINSTTAWTDQASGEAAEWLDYTNATLADWQTMADNIAVAATLRVSGLVDDYELMISTIAAGIHSFIDDMSDAAELWTQSGNSRSAGQSPHFKHRGTWRICTHVICCEYCEECGVSN